MPSATKKASHIRRLADTAREMLEHARTLSEQANAKPANSKERKLLEKEAATWLDKAEQIAVTANTIYR